MRHGASKPVELPTKDSVEASAVRVSHEPIELRPFLLRARNPYIHILAGDAPTAALTVLMKLKRLDAWVLALIGCRNASIERHSHDLLQFYRSSRAEKILHARRARCTRRGVLLSPPIPALVQSML